MNQPSPSAQFENAYEWRRAKGLFSSTNALRIFHGPGEGAGVFKNISIDQYGPSFWVTEWESKRPPSTSSDRTLVCDFLKGLSIDGSQSPPLSGVWLFRPLKATPKPPEVLFGKPSADRFVVREGEMKFLIQLQDSLHPGLFLDHAPLRTWLKANTKGLEVLNTFAYTGSLSVAAGLGGATRVTTLDLSRPTIEWARENWLANNLPTDRGDFIYGDVFEWLPKMRKRNQSFDVVILDPPSFSRSEKKTFSTSRDLVELHQHALGLLKPGGFLVTSINSANISRENFESDVFESLQTIGRTGTVSEKISKPETFKTRPGDTEADYLKGLIVRVKN